MQTDTAKALQTCAKNLDKISHYAEADALHEIMRRLAQNSGPSNNFDAPVGTRVIPFGPNDPMTSDLEDQEVLRQKHPRFHPEYHDLGQGGPDEQSVETQLHDGETTVTGPAVISNDPMSPSMCGGTDSFTWDAKRGTDMDPGDKYKQLLPH